jgi:thymidylate synthase (FAD)
MRIIKPLVVVEDDLGMILPNGMTTAQHMAKKIELFTRKCYRSEGRMTNDSYRTFLEGVFQGKCHTGIADHRMISITFITDRGVGEEGVRHRMAAPYLENDQQVPMIEGGGPLGLLKESTRYCDYAEEGKRALGLTFILPPWVNWQCGYDGSVVRWLDRKREQERVYNECRRDGWRPEQARAELPLGIKTEYVMSAPLGSWWNWCTKRTNVAAHPQMRQLAIPVLLYFRRHLPMFFNSVPYKDEPRVDGYHFDHKGEHYKEARLVVNPYYDAVPLEEVYSD